MRLLLSIFLLMFHLTSTPEEEAEWLSEAAADHAAFLAMRDLGIIDEARRRRLLIVEREAATQLLQRGPGVATDVFIAEQLRAAGIEVTRVDPPSAAMSNSVARRMLTDTTRRCACCTDVDAICKSPASVDRVNGIDARRQPAQAWSSLLATAESTVVSEGKEMTLRCGAEDADRTWEKLLR